MLVPILGTESTMEADTMATPELDTLTRKATAFASYAALTADMDRTGYFPTLRRSHREQAALGRVLESEGRRVFWVK
jgi:hypothetical protein